MPGRPTPVRLHKGLPIHGFASRRGFLEWLRDNVTQTEGVWVKFAKKASGLKSITYVEAREVAIIYGWIDGLKNAIDADFYAIRFTPRRKRSKWSQINREIAEQLIASKKMRKPGQLRVDEAKADGRWDAAYAGSATIEVHPALAKALRKSKRAKVAFDALSSANRYAILYALHDAKRESTRERRLERFIAMLERGDVPHPGR